MKYKTQFQTLGRIAAISALIVPTSGCISIFNGSQPPQAQRPSKESPFSFKNAEKPHEILPVAIIGGGIAGLYASVYTGMAGYKTVVFAGLGDTGGLLNQSHDVRNFPGDLATPGSTITGRLREQAQNAGATISFEKVTAINTKTWPYTLSLIDSAGTTRSMRVATCIVAMGTTPNYLNIPGEQTFWGRGVTNCALCDGSLYRNKTVAIIGGGDSAVTEALYLSSLAKKVYIIVRASQMRAQDPRKHELEMLPNVTIRYGFTTREILGDGSQVTGIRIEGVKENRVETISVDGVFLAIGSRPNTQLFAGSLALDPAGYIVTDRDQKTSIPGMYAAGDIADPRYKQAATALGDACRAALQAIDFLEHTDYKMLAYPSPKTPAPAKTIETPTPKPAPAPSGSVIEATSEQHLQSLIKGGDMATLVDFYATWCPPCKKMHPVIEKLAVHFAGKIRFVKVNVDTVQTNYGVQSIPTFITFDKTGVEKDRFVGAKAYDEVRTRLQKFAR